MSVIPRLEPALRKLPPRRVILYGRSLCERMWHRLPLEGRDVIEQLTAWADGWRIPGQPPDDLEVTTLVLQTAIILEGKERGSRHLSESQRDREARAYYPVHCLAQVADGLLHPGTAWRRLPSGAQSTGLFNPEEPVWLEWLRRLADHVCEEIAAGNAGSRIDPFKEELRRIFAGQEEQTQAVIFQHFVEGAYPVVRLSEGVHFTLLDAVRANHGAAWNIAREMAATGAHHGGILADALEDAGDLSWTELMLHLRSQEPDGLPAGWHPRGCWALDLVILEGREP